jgi:hypothetical protein
VTVRTAERPVRRHAVSSEQRPCQEARRPVACRDGQLDLAGGADASEAGAEKWPE